MEQEEQTGLPGEQVVVPCALGLWGVLVETE